MTEPTRTGRYLLAAALTALATSAACSTRAVEQTAVRRGDVAFAAANYDEALAEYRLAIRQGADDPETTARVAHTYAMMGRVDDAGAYYSDAAALDPDFTDQAVSDLMRLARDAQASGDRFAMATAVETALKLRPGIGVGEIALPLARHYFSSGEFGRALPFYQKAMAEATDSAPDIVFEVGQAYEEIGDCRHALVAFERFREMVRRWQRGEVDWYIGRCAFNLARDMRSRAGLDEDQLQEALRLIERAIEVGEPRNIQAQAWFEKGEILAESGRCEEAMEAYAQVRYTDQAGSLVDRAQARLDEIRFGRGLERLRDGRCR
jgi:tetratricopeptide (TPR) repeat protein